MMPSFPVFLLCSLLQSSYKCIGRCSREPIFRGAAINAAAGRELEMLRGLLADQRFLGATAGRNEILAELAECIVRSRSGERLEKLLELIG